jgi:hypothetical protein
MILFVSGVKVDLNRNLGSGVSGWEYYLRFKAGSIIFSATMIFTM